jgi:hypothetical protein
MGLEEGPLRWLRSLRNRPGAKPPPG